MSNRFPRWFACLSCVVVVVNAAPALCADAMSAPAHLRVELSDQSGLSLRVVDRLKDEVEQLWARQYCVDWSDRWRQECGTDGMASPLFVTVLARPVAGLGKEVIATVRFVGGRPLNHVHIYASQARHLAEQGLRSKPGYHHWPVAARDDAFGRVIGRALAHEIGHFLLRSPTHSRSGLMKARHLANALAGWSRAEFELDQASAAVLAVHLTPRVDLADDGAPPELTF